MSKTKSKTATEIATARLAEATATLSTYNNALRAATADMAQAEQSLKHGDNSVTGVDLVRHRGEVERLELLVNSAKSAVATAEKSVNHATTDVAVGIFAAVLNEQMKGYVPVLHLDPDDAVPAVKDRTVFVQLDRRHQGKVDTVNGTTTLHAFVYAASPVLDLDERHLLPGYGKGKAYTPPLLGDAGMADRIQWGQSYPRRVVGDTSVYGAAVKVTVASAVPLLQSTPAQHRWSTLEQGLRGALRRPRDSRVGSGDTIALDAWEATQTKASSTVAKDGTISSTFRATLVVNLGRAGDHDRAEESTKSRLAKFEGMHQPGVGHVESVTFGRATFKGLMVNGSPTSNVVMYQPVTLTFSAKLDDA